MRYVTQFLQTRLFDKTSKEFWLVVTPCSLLLLSLMLLLKESSSFFQICLLSTASAYLSWKFSLKGFLIAGVVSVAAFSFILVSSSESIGLWHWMWMLSLELSLFVTSLASSEYLEAQGRERKKIEEEFARLEKEHRQALDVLERELEVFQEEKAQVLENQAELEKNLKSYKSLSIACKEESDKYFSECENLKEEIVCFKDQIAAFEISSLEESMSIKKLQKQKKVLNELRVQNFQNRLILDDYRKKEIQYDSCSQSQTSHAGSEEVKIEIEKLQRDRESLKSLYEDKLRDFEATSEKFKTFFTMNEMLEFKDPNGSFELTYSELNNKLKSLGDSLGEMRSEIFKIEGEILEYQKLIDDSSCKEPIQSYLRVADQECLRLENENQVLKKHLNEVIQLESKKPPKDS